MPLPPYFRTVLVGVAILGVTVALSAGLVVRLAGAKHGSRLHTGALCVALAGLVLAAIGYALWSMSWRGYFVGLLPVSDSAAEQINILTGPTGPAFGGRS